MDPAAVVFDLDGVLLDSEQLWDEVRRGLAADWQRPWPAGTTAALQGMSTGEWSAYLAGEVGVPLSAEQIAAQVVRRMADRYREHLPLLPGAVPAVRALSGHWPLGVASSAPAELIRTALAAAGIADRFRAVASSEEVPRGKPAPDVYRLAAQRLGADPTRCVAVEDSANGLRAAAAAGMTVVATPNPHFPPPPEALALAAAVVPGVTDVTPELVATL